MLQYNWYTIGIVTFFLVNITGIFLCSLEVISVRLSFWRCRSDDVKSAVTYDREFPQLCSSRAVKTWNPEDWNVAPLNLCILYTFIYSTLIIILRINDLHFSPVLSTSSQNASASFFVSSSILLCLVLFFVLNVLKDKINQSELAVL